ncbi:hypothetical protein HEP87_58855 [Streptomyces sp. S1D4-11]|nr:hypothetical protein [Streptomyces sp. S1D4-11]
MPPFGEPIEPPEIDIGERAPPSSRTAETAASRKRPPSARRRSA